MYSPGSFLAMWNKVYKNIHHNRYHETSGAEMMIISKVRTVRTGSYSLVLIGLETVHVVGASDAPGTQEFQQVDFHWGLHKDKVVVWHAEAEIVKERMSEFWHSVTLITYKMYYWQRSCAMIVHTPVHIGGLEPLSTGELHHHLGLLNGIRVI